MKVKSVSRLDKPYEGGDVFAEWHKEKTKSSMDEASKGADYATPIWRCETENERGWRMIKACAGIASGVGVAYFFAVSVMDWLKG